VNTNELANQYDVIIVGSGAGGAAAADRLVNAGLRVLMIEKGRVLPKDSSTLDIDRVVHQGTFKSHEAWRDGHNRAIVPEEYFNLGGKTKWYGAALLRFSPGEFDAEPANKYTGWPISYSSLAPYYAIAEQRLSAVKFDCEPDLSHILSRLARKTPEWLSEPLPLGLATQILSNPTEARHFDGFASPSDLKSDADTAFLRPILARRNFTLLTGTAVTELIGDETSTTRIAGVRLQGGQSVYARAVLLAAGALHSPRLLQRYLEATALSRVLPAYQSVGRNLKLHLLTAVVAVSLTKKTDLLRKTRLLLNRELPHSSVQPLGFDSELISTLIPKIVPRWLASIIGDRSYGFFLQTEDGAHRDNRVLDVTDGSGVVTGSPILDYDAARTPISLGEHGKLVRRFCRALRAIGMLAFAQRIDIVGTAHASGTLTAGMDPATSVVDAQGAVHGMQALYVVDGSILPRASRVNPSLSIFAWSLRVADQLSLSLGASSERATAMNEIAYPHPSE
jgi:choline dehydrogenase-like flavoprotein